MVEPEPVLGIGSGSGQKVPAPAVSGSATLIYNCCSNVNISVADPGSKVKILLNRNT